MNMINDSREFEIKKSLQNDFFANVGKLFLLSNIAVTLVLFLCLISDIVLMIKGVIKPDQRLVTTNILVGLVGATLVQLGALVVMMTRAIFRM